MRLIVLDFTSQMCYFFSKAKAIFEFSLLILTKQFKGYFSNSVFFHKHILTGFEALNN